MQQTMYILHKDNDCMSQVIYHGFYCNESFCVVFTSLLITAYTADIPLHWLTYDGDSVRESLRRIRPSLESRLPDHILPSLLASRGIVTETEVLLVCSASNPILKNRALLDVLVRKDCRFILQFFNMLRSHPDLTGYSELVEAFISNLKSLTPKNSMNLPRPINDDLSTGTGEIMLHGQCTE